MDRFDKTTHATIHNIIYFSLSNPAFPISSLQLQRSLPFVFVVVAIWFGRPAAQYCEVAWLSANHRTALSKRLMIPSTSMLLEFIARRPSESRLEALLSLSIISSPCLAPCCVSPLLALFGHRTTSPDPYVYLPRGVDTLL